MARSTPEIPNASMADIAFLLLTFFLVTTTIANDRGLSLTLPPPPQEDQPIVKQKAHNLFTIQINSSDQLLVEGEPLEDLSGMKDELVKFIMNNGADPTMSDSPKEAIVSYKTDRGTSQAKFIEVLDIIQNAYYDIWAERAGVTNKEFRAAASDTAVPENKAIYDKGLGRKPDGTVDFPMNISIAEPTKVGG